MIGLTHAEDVANRATRCVADDNYPALQRAVANDPPLAVVLAGVLYLDRDPSEHKGGVFEIEASLFERLNAFGRIVSDTHWLLYLQ